MLRWDFRAFFRNGGKDRRRVSAGNSRAFQVQQKSAPMEYGLHSCITRNYEASIMVLNIKLLAGSIVGAAGVMKLWTDPGGWGIILNVLGALLLSWILFVAVLYLTAARLRREPEKSRKRKSVQAPAQARVQYDQYDRSGFTRISR
jgi:hypothetical protein